MSELQALLNGDPGYSCSRWWRGYRLHWQHDKRCGRYRVSYGPQELPAGTGATRSEALRNARATIDKVFADQMLTRRFATMRLR